MRTFASVLIFAALVGLTLAGEGGKEFPTGTITAKDPDGFKLTIMRARS